MNAVLAYLYIVVFWLISRVVVIRCNYELLRRTFVPRLKLLFPFFFSVSPMIWIPNQLLGAPEGADIKLECHTESSPKAIAYWNYNVSNGSRFYLSLVCLLYTSPSPRDRQKSRMPSSA